MKERVMGMVLSAATIGEYDKRIVLLTKERGRISAFARGARRPKSPLSASTEPFTFGEFFIYCGRDSYTIEQVEVKNFFPELRKDLDNLYMALYFLRGRRLFYERGNGSEGGAESFISLPAGADGTVAPAYTGAVHI